MDGEHAAPEQLNAMMGDLHIRAGAPPSLEALPQEASAATSQAKTVDVQPQQEAPVQSPPKPRMKNVWSARHEEMQRRFREAAEAEAAARRLVQEQRRQQLEMQNRGINGHVVNWGQSHGRVHPAHHPVAWQQQHQQQPNHAEHGQAHRPMYTGQHAPHSMNHAPQQPPSRWGYAVAFPDQLQHYLVQQLFPTILPIAHETATLEMGRQTIEQIIQEICPGGRLVPFGSLVNDLGLRHSGE